jgi:hypothetical protein
VKYLNITIGWHRLSVHYQNANKEVIEKIKKMFPFKESKKRNKYLITIVFTKPERGFEIKINRMSSIFMHGNTAKLYWKNVRAFPTLYRALYIFSQYVHLKNKSFLIHSAGLKKDNYGYIFVGHSGSGKTTIAQKMPKENLLNDEAVAIKKSKNHFYIKGTPFGTYYSNSLKPVRLKYMFLLTPSTNTSIAKINYPSSLSKFLVHIPFLYHFTIDLRKNAFFLLSELCKSVYVFHARLTMEANIKKIIKMVKMVSE